MPHEYCWNTLLVLCMLTSPFLILSIATSLTAAAAAAAPSSCNVLSYGAVGDGKADDSQAFLKAWKQVCQAQTDVSTLVIPGNKTYLLKPSTFSGPCKPCKIYVQVSGNLVAPSSKSQWIGHHVNTWLAFSYVDGLTITGQGKIDGQGSTWWQQPCFKILRNEPKCHAPTALTFNRCNCVELNGLTHINSPRSHITVTSCKNVVISSLHIVAPETSPNTDGIDISGSTNVWIRDCNIGTGDDCVAISGGSSNINISGVYCGPGHGISIGALGRGGFDAVELVHVWNCTLKRTMTGVRIKTWQGGRGYARRISFEKIRLVEVSSPIIIDQFYCPSRVNCENKVAVLLRDLRPDWTFLFHGMQNLKTSAVELCDISYAGITGTSTTDKVINLSCNQISGCTNIQLDQVYITSTTPGKTTYANCINAHGRYSHTRPAIKCLLP